MMRPGWDKYTRYPEFSYCGALTFRDILWLEQQHLWYWLHITPCRWVRGKQVLETAISEVGCYLRRLEPAWVIHLLNKLPQADLTALLFRLTPKGVAGILVRFDEDEHVCLLRLLDKTTCLLVAYEMQHWPTEFYFSVRS
jgi:hypothetical protein